MKTLGFVVLVVADMDKVGLTLNLANIGKARLTLESIRSVYSMMVYLQHFILLRLLALFIPLNIVQSSTPSLTKAVPAPHCA